MKKNVKNSLLATLSLSAVCALCVGVSSVKNASAETQAPTADIVVAGAGVYVGGGTENGVDKSGIRFQVLAKKSLVESGAEIGALLLPADMTTATELEVDTVVIQNEEIEGTETVTNETLSAEKWTASSYTDYLQTYVYLYNFPVNDYNREILASAYIKSGENYIYSETVSRSMAYVALAAENEGDDRAVGYIKQYHVNYYGEDGETEISGLENVGVRYGSLIEKPADPVSATSNKVFAGWYADKACTEAFDFTKAVKGTTNVYSGWIDGYVFTKNGFQLFEDGVAAAGTGWTASAVLKGGNVPSSDLRLERGGIALKATYSSGIRR
ncbi:MAG: InlB B-repeat-containing protein, partial [Clostridia bacterium]|nr:InlB B-repeat-containing protein [Clostridia bacterium]